MTEEEIKQSKLKKLGQFVALFAVVGGFLYKFGKDIGATIHYWLN